MTASKNEALESSPSLHIFPFLTAGWFRIGHSQVVTRNNRCPGAQPPPLHTVCSTGKGAHAHRDVSLEMHTGAACLRATSVRPRGSNMS